MEKSTSSDFPSEGQDHGIPLPAVLDPKAARELKETLEHCLHDMENQSTTVTLLGNDVSKASTAALQVIVAGTRAFTAQGRKLTIESASPALSSAIMECGLAPLLPTFDARRTA